ncbi:MAG TPA: hypothetical protein VNX40_16090 [Mucilaginibacter sp.]|jgi:hypothetical protein|nr:hypothetical protein [Mucilaginibacter sp.]
MSYDDSGNDYKCCPYCDEVEETTFLFKDFRGNGRCKRCHGEGEINDALFAEAQRAVEKILTFGLGNSDIPDMIPCPKCHGTRQCQACGGHGRIKNDLYDENEKEKYANDDVGEEDDADDNEYDDYNYEEDDDSYDYTGYYKKSENEYNEDLNKRNELDKISLNSSSKASIDPHGEKQRKSSNSKKLAFLLILIITSVVLFSVKTSAINEDRGFFHFVLIAVIFICVSNIIGPDISDGVIMGGLSLSCVYGLWAGAMFSDAVSHGSFDEIINFIILVPCFVIGYGIGGALVGFITKLLLDL